MIKKKFEITLPDETQLIAEAAEESDYPCINIYQRDTEGEIDTVAFAEYNPDNLKFLLVKFKINNFISCKIFFELLILLAEMSRRQTDSKVYFRCQP